MSRALALDTSPLALLRAFRGTVDRASLGYPDVLHLELVDGGGDRWRFATQDAEWHPRELTELQGASVVDVAIDEDSGALRIEISGRAPLKVEPAQPRGELPTWELLAPSGLVLEFGPGIGWRITPAGDRA